MLFGDPGSTEMITEKSFTRDKSVNKTMAIPHEAEYRPGEEEPDLFRVANSRRGGKQVETEPLKVR